MRIQWYNDYLTNLLIGVRVMSELSVSKLEQDAKQELLRIMQSRCDTNWFMELRHCIPQLLETISDSRNVDSLCLAQNIRLILLEQHHVTESCGNMSYDSQTLDLQVNVLVDSMKYLRDKRLKNGKASDLPVTPLMCG